MKNRHRGISQGHGTGIELESKGRSKMPSLKHESVAAKYKDLLARREYESKRKIMLENQSVKMAKRSSVGLSLT